MKERGSAAGRSLDETELLEKIRALSARRQSEVIDFVEFLSEREATSLTDEVSVLSEPVFVRVWDNADDAEYDRL